MYHSCRRNPWIAEGVGIAVQVAFIFVFLTLFFFNYVTRVERDEFERQIHIVVDDAMSGIKDDIKRTIQERMPLSSDDYNLLIGTIAYMAEQKLAQSTRTVQNEVTKNNQAVRKKAVLAMSIVCAGVALVAIGLYMAGFCVSAVNNVKDAMIMVTIVAITELVFLHVIAKNYISVSPNKIKQKFAESIQRWIADNVPEVQQSLTY